MSRETFQKTMRGKIASEALHAATPKYYVIPITFHLLQRIYAPLKPLFSVEND
jgi:hypothetical protein